jgi:hypothetical protein
VGRHGSAATQGAWNVTNLMANFALVGIDVGGSDVGSKSRESNFVIRKMTFVTGARTSNRNNIAVVGGTALVVGVVVVVGGGHDDDDGGGGWFG